MPVVSRVDPRALAAAHRRLAESYLRQQEALGCIRPEWRFAWVDAGGAIRARVVYWGLPGAEQPCLLDVVLGDDDQATTELLATSLRDLAIGTIDYQPTRETGADRGADEPPALEACGFALVAIQERLVHSGPAPDVPVMPDVALRSVREVGYDPLIPLSEMVRSATADRATATPADAAGDVAALREAHHDPGWWSIAFAAGSPVGFVLPIRTDGGPVIGDIGVVPAARGRGIGHLLLAHATSATLAVTGRVGADVDEDNRAMLAIATATGFTRYATRAHYARSGAAAFA
jgi:ribosomal protein S18 acetylase RimI-like enzyme